MEKIHSSNTFCPELIDDRSAGGDRDKIILAMRMDRKESVFTSLGGVTFGVHISMGLQCMCRWGGLNFII